MVAKKEIIYPVFLECCAFTTDSFWENIFEDLAYGKTPYGTYINKNFLCCSYKNKEFSYKIERKDANTLYDDIYILLTKKLGILSYKEKIKSRVDFHTTESRLKKHSEEWSNIRKKNIKDLLIEGYVIDMKNKHKLSIKQSKYLLSVIFMSVVFKVITSKDINYSDGKIQEINGIEFIDRKIVINKNIYDMGAALSPDIVIPKKTMSDNWEKYLTTLHKYKLH